MDLNYLFYRQQIERSLAEAARSEEARKIHEELAVHYEREISLAAAAGSSDGENPALFSWLPKTDSAASSKVNPTMAVAITAREVGTTPAKA